MHASLVWRNWARDFLFNTHINQGLKSCLVMVSSRSVENCRFWSTLKSDWSRQVKRCLQKKWVIMQNVTLFFPSSHDLVYLQNSSSFPKLILVNTDHHIRIVEVHGGSKVTDLLVYFAWHLIYVKCTLREKRKLMRTVHTTFFTIGFKCIDWIWVD